MRAGVPLTSSLRVDGKALLFPRARFARYRFAFSMLRLCLSPIPSSP